jgi:hypothetical protein
MNSNESEHPEDANLLFAFTDNLRTHAVCIAGNNVNILIDSGASCNIISSAVANKLPANCIEACKRTVHPFRSKPLTITQRIVTTVSAHGKSANAEFLIVPGNDIALLGRKTATDLDLLRIGPPAQVNAATDQSPDVQELLRKYPGIADGIGKLKDYQVKFHIDDSVQPIARRHNRVPFHLRDKVSGEIAKLLNADIIEPVDGPTDWVSRIVTPPKPHDPSQIRVCVDMRDANTAIKRVRHVTPTMDDLINDLNGAKVFSKIDLRCGYHQLELAPESRPITTFATHEGLYRYKRLNFGVNTAAEVFQKAVQSVIAGIPGVRNISDDIIVFGKSKQDHDTALHAVLSRLHEQGLTVNAEKMALNKSSIEFFGVVFSANGVSPSPAKVKALKNAAQPSNPSEVKSFLGLAQYCARFIHNFSTLSEPLRALTHQGAKWKFGPNEIESFNKIRNALTDMACNAYFVPRKETQVLVDASPVGLSAILVQDGRQVTFASRSLSSVEQRYSQLEHEALAVTWACEQLNIYLQGNHFKILTDHKPLLGIWKKAELPLRLSRWALRLQGYNMTLVYRPGHDNPADYMSRHPETSAPQYSYTDSYVNFVTQQSLPKAITLKEVQSATSADETFKCVMSMCQSGNWNSKSPDHKIDRNLFDGLYQVRDQLTVAHSILLRDTRIVIPTALQA